VKKILGVLVALALVLTGCASTSSSGDRVVRAAVASDLRFAFPEIIELVHDQHPDIDVRVTYGSSGQFMTQILNGAPFDLYLSADQAYPAIIVEERFAAESELFRYARGRLVVWNPATAAEPPSLEDVLDARQIALANPRHAPYGRAAVQALTNSGLLPEVEDRLVFGENVAQAVEFAQAGTADLALIAMSLVIEGPVAQIGAWTEVPQDLFDPLEQGGVVMTAAADVPAARTVRDVLLSPAGKQVLARYGFLE